MNLVICTAIGHYPKLSDGATIVESMAILQYLEETRPEPPLYPGTPLLRARMREVCEVCHIQSITYKLMQN